MIKIRGLTKAFNGRRVLDNVDLDLHPGEFVALLGPNGAGKSTLIKILDGIYQADAGSVRGDHGEDLSSHIGVVHQDMGLIDDLSVWDNLRLRSPPIHRRSGVLDRPAERRAVKRALERFGLDISPMTPVSAVSPAQRALLAVARVADRDSKIIILDEVTSTLSTSDAKMLIATLRERSSDGVCFVMVTHKLSEALELASRVVVLRDGRLVCDQGIPLPSLEEVTALLSPDTSNANPGERGIADSSAGEVLLEMKGVVLGAVGPIDLTVRAGEVVGVTGRAGSSLPVIGYLAAQAVRPEVGRVVLHNRARTAIVPPSREREGNFGELSVRWNMTVASLRRFRKIRGLLNLSAERDGAHDMLTRLRVTPADLDGHQGVLSGGNQQKVIFGRALLTDAEVFVLCEPTRGVDVATRRQLYDLMADLKSKGCALLVVSSDPDDVLALADRVLIFEDGRIKDSFQASHLTTSELASIV